MALINEVSTMQFNTELIKAGDLICVSCDLWNEPKRGVVILATQEQIAFLYYPGIANVTTRMTLFAEDLADGKYTVRWSDDMITVNEYVPDTNEEESS